MEDKYKVSDLVVENRLKEALSEVVKSRRFTLLSRDVEGMKAIILEMIERGENDPNWRSAATILIMSFVKN